MYKIIPCYVGFRTFNQEKDWLPKLFSKFTAHSLEDIGFGLYIAKSNIESHEGMIWAENNNTGRQHS